MTSKNRFKVSYGDRIKKAFEYPNSVAVSVRQGKFEGERIEELSIRYRKNKDYVVVKGQEYHFLGFTERPLDEVSAARGLTGAAIGSLFGTFGALAGGALGSMKQRNMIVTMGMMNKNTQEVSMLEVEVKKNDMYTIDKFPIAEMKERIDVTEQQQIDNIINRKIVE